MTTEQPELIDAKRRLLDGTSGLTIQRSQELPTSFLDSLKEKKAATSRAPCGDFHHFASIPVAVIEKWQREGFDILTHKYSAREIMQKLSAENLGDFITTTKAL